MIRTTRSDRLPPAAPATTAKDVLLPSSPPYISSLTEWRATGSGPFGSTWRDLRAIPGPFVLAHSYALHVSHREVDAGREIPCRIQDWARAGTADYSSAIEDFPQRGHLQAWAESVSRDGSACV